MTITLSYWAIPAVLTAGVWIWLFMRADPAPRGDYDFGNPVLALLQFGVALIATLAVWLAYFIIV